MPQPQVFLIIIHWAVVIIVLIGFGFSCIHSLISFSLRVLLSTFSSSERAWPVGLTITDSKLFLPGGSLLWIVYLLDFVETFRNRNSPVIIYLMSPFQWAIFHCLKDWISDKALVFFLNLLALNREFVIIYHSRNIFRPNSGYWIVLYVVDNPKPAVATLKYIFCIWNEQLEMLIAPFLIPIISFVFYHHI